MGGLSERVDGAEPGPSPATAVVGGRKVRPSHPKRRSAADDRWEDILVAAGKVFLDKGYAGATVQDVASEAGMLSGSLYYYIDSKEDLLFALVQRVHAQGLAHLDDPGVHTGDPLSRLTRFLELWSARLEGNREWSLLVEREFRTLSEGRRTAIVEQRSAYESLLRGIIAEGVAAGVFAADTDPVVATQVVFQTLNYTALWFRPGGRLTFAEVMAWECRFILAGLVGRTPTARPKSRAPRTPAPG